MSVRNTFFLAFLFMAGAAHGQTVPPQITGFGTLAVSNTSALVSTITIGPNSRVWPTSSATGLVTFLNDSASSGNVYLCPFGGTCSASNGLELTPGRAWTLFQPATTATVFSSTTATLQVQW